MKVAFVTTNLKGGGAEKSVLRLAGDLHARGHSVHVVLLENRLDHAVPAGIVLHALTAPGKEASKGWLGKRLAARRLRRLFETLSAEAPFELIVSTLPYCDEVVALAGLTPAWYRIANTLSVEIERLARNSRTKAARRLRRYREIYDGRNLIAVSDGVARDLSEGLGLRRANVIRIYNAIDAAAVRALSAQHEPALPREPYLIHVGRFAPQKRHDLLLDALRRSALPHRLVLLADPSAALDRLIADKGLAQRVTVAGFQRNPYPWIAVRNCSCCARTTRGCPMCCSKRSPAGRASSAPTAIGSARSDGRAISRATSFPAATPTRWRRVMRSALFAPRPKDPAVLERFSPQIALARYESLPACGAR
jgi:glycosyltransferase involved in cell wall biosynthesis